MPAAVGCVPQDIAFEKTDAATGLGEPRPVPGQGIVRVSQWISQRDVTNFPPNTRDLGNNRGPGAHFDPEDTKVTT